jgi:CBS domain-containing protein
MLRARSLAHPSQGIGSITVRDILSRMPAPPAPEGGPEHAAHHPPFSIHEERSVLDAIAEMARLNTHALVVLDRRGSLSGIITERDYIYKVKVAGLTSIDTLVSEIMTPTPWCASLDFTLDDVLTVMTRYGFRHMPVVGSVGEPEPGGEPPRVDDGGSSPFRPRCHGIISITDVMRTICEWPDRPLSWPDNEPPLPGPL